MMHQVTKLTDAAIELAFKLGYIERVTGRHLHMMESGILYAESAGWVEEERK